LPALHRKTPMARCTAVVCAQRLKSEPIGPLGSSASGAAPLFDRRSRRQPADLTRPVATILEKSSGPRLADGPGFNGSRLLHVLHAAKLAGVGAVLVVAAEARAEAIDAGVDRAERVRAGVAGRG